jgi:hypothetical protein
LSRKNSRRNNQIPGKIYTSETIKFRKEDLMEYYRADCVFRGVAMNVPSYEGRVFLNYPAANLKTPKDTAHGYVGSYFIFGHAKCLGDEGHCDIPQEHTPRSIFDDVPFRLQPEPYISIRVTDYLKKLSKKTQEFTVTIVPKVCKIIEDGLGAEIDYENVVKIDKVSIEIYDKEGEV